MSRHIDLVGQLYLAAAALSALLAAALVSLGLGALSLAWEADAANPLAAGVTATGFFVFALVLLVWAAANAWAGRALRLRQPWGRLVALGLAVLHLFVLPFGTALGVYGLWVLVHNQTRTEFGA